MLGEFGKWAEAEASDREAVRLSPADPVARFNHGSALYRLVRYADAEAELRESIRRNPASASAHCQLGLTLRDQGRFAEALDELQRGNDLGGRAPGWRSPSAEWVRDCRHLVEMDRRLPAVLAGDAEGGAAERIELVSFCVLHKHLPAAAARLADAILADDAALSDDQRDLCRYDGACGAALAAAGRGEDARALPDKVVVMLRGRRCAGCAATWHSTRGRRRPGGGREAKCRAALGPLAARRRFGRGARPGGARPATGRRAARMACSVDRRGGAAAAGGRREVSQQTSAETRRVVAGLLTKVLNTSGRVE